MIRYTLRCARGHGFESWFQNSGAYDSQRRRKLVTCPVCDSAEVEKALMAPQVGRSSRRREEAPAPQAEAQPQPQAPLMTGEAGELRAKLRELRDFVKNNADDVGERFPAEARKMHYGDIEHRAIYGKASSHEARELVEEGIDITPLPPLPDDTN
ncbi:MAG: DUF1178 family protein [Xanthobacteraceae bacterium]